MFKNGYASAGNTIGMAQQVDLIIGVVLIRGAAAPKLADKEAPINAKMWFGMVILAPFDIAIGFGIYSEFLRTDDLVKNPSAECCRRSESPWNAALHQRPFWR